MRPLPADKRACNIQGELRLCDADRSALLRQHVQILDAAVQHVDGMNDSQMTDVRYIQLDSAAGELFGGEANHARQKIDLLHRPALRAMRHLACLRCRVVKGRYPGLPAEALAEIFGQNGITDEIGVGGHARHESCGTLYLQVIRPEGQGLPTYQEAAR